MSEKRTLTKDKVPLLEKAAFGAGHLVNNLLPGSLGVFAFFLLTAFGMDPFLAGLLGGLPRFFDAITDPIMGYISDNTKSKYGRRKPYIFIGAILSGVLFAVLWQLNPDNTQMYNFWYFLILSMVYLIGNTMFSTPLIGLGYEMTSDYNERTRLMGFSQTIGQIAWMIVPWFWVIIANPDLFETQAIGVRQLSIIVGGVCMLLGIMPALVCKEIDQANLSNRDDLTFKNIAKNFKGLLKGMAQVFKHAAFVRLCGATFLVFNGFQMVASFSYFIIVFYMFRGDYGLAGTWPAWFSTISAVATAFLIIPVITWMANKWGKRDAFIVATFLSIVGYGLKWWGFNPDNPWLMFMPLPLMVFGIGGLFTLMMSMTADVCDLDELANGMPRKEGTFGAIYWWMVKLGQGLALVLGGLVLKLVGFDQNETIQTADTITNLRLADIFVPAITAGLAIVVMWKYDLTEEKARNIKDELVKRRGEL
ncbi:MAG: MFS transporter [Bacteroidetes bacterium]|jgi:GPH family glycoside/pentoside/hexuronide:cation symporter|nr:MFS transporter [Bacteroidota bacterium]MBU1580387.1 MFS transporter [Bacteroidota bacterium]MBU2466044.1 MFS transporter [Bacteroidota bacterium]MBU2557927.1 MFS transporter [Bacteroidota bacterium]MDA3943077.1 MFS transporter [Bacteroidota bacterium]